MNSIERTARPYARLASRAFAFAFACASCVVVSVGVLLLLLWQMVRFAWGWLDWNFLTSFDSQLSPEKAGVLAALVGSVYLIGLTTLLSVPLGVGAAIYLEEYAPPSRWRTFVQTNIANLAGVPSIVYGILGLGLFVRGWRLGPGVVAGALTLTLVVLPIVILASQEALRAVPSTIRQASYALGATRWQTVWRQLLPAAMPGILTGVILALSRALGEAAPLVAIGAAGFITFLPAGINDHFTALPLQIYHWTENSNVDFHHVAAAGIVVLLAVLIGMNAVAIVLRRRFSKQIRW